MFERTTTLAFGSLWGSGQLQWITAWTLLFVAVLGGMFFFWKKAKAEYFDLWAAFDAVFIASLLGLIASRLSYIIFHLEDFGLSLTAWVHILAFPGLWAPPGILMAAWYLHRWAQQQKLDTWEVWDFFVILMSWFFGWYWLSRFILGAGAGRPTDLPWGVLFPSRLEPAHPVQLYAALGFGVIFAYLWWVEPRYRFFLWYRSKKRTAKTGFLTAMFLIGWGVLGFLLSFVQYSFFLIFDIDMNQAVSALLFFVGCGLLYVRSGRTFFSK